MHYHVQRGNEVKNKRLLFELISQINGRTHITFFNVMIRCCIIIMIDIKCKCEIIRYKGIEL